MHAPTRSGPAPAGRHEVLSRASSASTRRDTILPPDLFRRFENDSFRLNPEVYPRKVLVA